MQARWEIRGNELWLIDGFGVGAIPSMEKIYQSLVERCSTELPIAPNSVEGLRVSRYPLVAVVVIREQCLGIPAYSVVATCRGIVIDLQLIDLERGHIISNGVWYPIDPCSRGEVLGLFHSNGITIGPAQSLRAFLAICQASATGGPVENKMDEKSISPMAFAPATDDLPIGIKATLYPYQHAGWRWLKYLLAEGIGGLLADEMGLGKTLQVISVLSDSAGLKLRPALIVAPGSILENWSREIAKFAPHLKVLKHHGPFRTGRPIELEAYDVIVTSYDCVVIDNSLLNMIFWKVIVLDEAQFIKNPEARRTKAIKRLRREVGLAMTGTPVENSLIDMWSIMDFVRPGYLGDIGYFVRNFPDGIEGAAKLEVLASPLILRRKVAEVAKDLPARIDIPQLIELDDSEVLLYESERKRIFEEYGAAATLVALTSLRRFCSHPSLMDRTSDVASPMSFSKFRRLDEIVKEIFACGQKVIIFTSFTAMADMISRHINQSFNKFVGVIDGRLNIDDRQPLIDEFSAIKGGAALVLNPKAGGSGLNITAANHVIHYNPEWNPALEDQASARAYRRGQTLPVTVHRLLVADTVEDVVNDRLVRKREISSAAVIGVVGVEGDYGDIVKALSRSPLKRRDSLE